jgi:hypothetical protein
MSSGRSPKRVREPVQVYLDRPDLTLLDQVARRLGLPKAEVLRRGLRVLAEQAMIDRAPGWSLTRLIGALGDDPTVPTDLAARHDDYLYGTDPHGRPRPR